MKKRNLVADALDRLNADISGLILEHRQRVSGGPAVGEKKDIGSPGKQLDDAGVELVEDEPEGAPEVEPDEDDFRLLPLGRSLARGHHAPMPPQKKGPGKK